MRKTSFFQNRIQKFLITKINKKLYKVTRGNSVTRGYSVGAIP